MQEGLSALVESGHYPGAIAILYRDGKVIEHARAGWLDVEKGESLPEDALFRFYSMSKPITSVAIMMLAEEGRLKLDDPASEYLPEFADMQVYVSGDVDDMQAVPVAAPITIAQLLSHNSGLTYHFGGDTPVHEYYRKYGVMRDTPVGRLPTDGEPAHSLDELVARLGKAPLLRQPGTGFEYSYSTTVLGAVVERVTGKRLDEALRQMIFAPLGMFDTGFYVSDKDLPRFTTLYSATGDGIAVAERPEKSDYRDRNRLLDGGGAVVGTAADYLRFAAMLANGGTLDGVKILSSQSVDEMFVPRVAVTGMSDVNIPFGYGFAIGTAETAAKGYQPAGTVSWSGSGNTYFFVDPETRLIGLLMTHELTGADIARSVEIRQVLNRAARPYLSH